MEEDLKNDNTMDLDSDTKELSEESDEYDIRQPVKFSNTFSRLPANGPPNHAHIVHLPAYDPDEEDGYDIKLPDAIATMLFNMSEDTLTRFLDSQVKSFRLSQEFTDGVNKLKLVIWRRGSLVLIGDYVDHPNEGLFEWENLVRLSLNYDGTWKTTEASFGIYTKRDMRDAWNSTFVRTMWSVCEKHANSDRDRVALACMLAVRIMYNSCWNAEISKWTIEES